MRLYIEKAGWNRVKHFGTLELANLELNLNLGAWGHYFLAEGLA